MDELALIEGRANTKKKGFCLDGMQNTCGCGGGSTMLWGGFSSVGEDRVDDKLMQLKTARIT